MSVEGDHQLRDVIIIGGGPAGLAVASRLSEPLPGANFTDEEHQRYNWIKKHSDKVSIKNYRNNKDSQPSVRIGTRPEMLVLDSSGEEWLSRWNSLFNTFDISHLRSPMFFHIDPAERDGLLSYTHLTGRTKELIELRGCVGKDVSKHHRKQKMKRRQPAGEPTVDERERNDYFVPSTDLFNSHCHHLIKRYSLDRGIVRQETVLDMRYGYVSPMFESDKVFTIQTNKTTYFARAAVLAVGPANPPVIPGLDADYQHEAMTHAMKISDFPSAHVKARMSQKQATNLVVVGGGLTSAQLADLAIRRGVSRVFHIMRGPLKSKPFDLDLPWVGKWRNFEQAAFLTADSRNERWEKIKTARNGGSITPRYRDRLDCHIKAGKLLMFQHTVITSRQWEEASKVWNLTISTRHWDQIEQSWIEADEQKLPPVHHIYYATGVQTDVGQLPFLQSIRAQYPVEDCGGLPCITDDMKWRDDLPLFLTGKLAALELGPGAANLVGARIGADRVAWSVQDFHKQDDDAAESSSGGPRGERFNYVTGRGNRFSAIAVE